LPAGASFADLLRPFKDRSPERFDDLPAPDVLAQEIAEGLQAAWEQFSAIREKLKG
jgi:type I restriction enzyme M protein